MANTKDTSLELLEQTYRELDEILDSFTDEELLRPSSNVGWSAQDTLAHLATIEERTRGQINAAISGNVWAPAEQINDYNERVVAARRGVSIKDLRDELTQQHLDTMGLLRGTRADDFDKLFDHPRLGRITLGRMLENTAQHVRTHSSEIAAVRAG